MVQIGRHTSCLVFFIYVSGFAFNECHVLIKRLKRIHIVSWTYLLVMCKWKKAYIKDLNALTTYSHSSNF